MKLYCFINGKLLLLSSDFHLFLSIDLFIFFVKGVGGWGLKVRYELWYNVHIRLNTSNDSSSVYIYAFFVKYNN